MKLLADPPVNLSSLLSFKISQIYDAWKDTLNETNDLGATSFVGLVIIRDSWPDLIFSDQDRSNKTKIEISSPTEKFYLFPLSEFLFPSA